jgi:hypothetical protein
VPPRLLLAAAVAVDEARAAHGNARAGTRRRSRKRVVGAAVGGAPAGTRADDAETRAGGMLRAPTCALERPWGGACTPVEATCVLVEGPARRKSAGCVGAQQHVGSFCARAQAAVSAVLRGCQRERALSAAATPGRCVHQRYGMHVCMAAWPRVAAPQPSPAARKRSSVARALRPRRTVSARRTPDRPRGGQCVPVRVTPT